MRVPGLKGDWRTRTSVALPWPERLSPRRGSSSGSALWNHCDRKRTRKLTTTKYPLEPTGKTAFFKLANNPEGGLLHGRTRMYVSLFYRFREKKTSAWVGLALMERADFPAFAISASLVQSNSHQKIRNFHIHERWSQKRPVYSLPILRVFLPENGSTVSSNRTHGR